MSEDSASSVLERTLDPKLPHTVADAAAKSGLSLGDAERGLHELVTRYRGHLRVTEEGQLVFVFPHGFSAPWVTTGRLEAAARKVSDALGSILRFGVRGWVALVLLG